jgi:uncharacterized protein (DUF305 family)
MLRILAFIVCVFALYYSVSSGSAAQIGGDPTTVAAASNGAPADQSVLPGLQPGSFDNVDTVFVEGMITHHQSAIDMANVELKYGTDPDVRKLAEQIIAAQSGQILWMQDWLGKPGK